MLTFNGALTKTVLTKSVLATVMAGSVMMGAGAASADVACNRAGECWHVGQRYNTYPPALGVVFHDDDWRAHHMNRHYRWHDHGDDHGYYDHGAWRPF